MGRKNWLRWNYISRILLQVGSCKRIATGIVCFTATSFTKYSNTIPRTLGQINSYLRIKKRYFKKGIIKLNLSVWAHSLYCTANFAIILLEFICCYCKTLPVLGRSEEPAITAPDMVPWWCCLQDLLWAHERLYIFSLFCRVQSPHGLHPATILLQDPRLAEFHPVAAKPLHDGPFFPSCNPPPPATKQT